MTHRQVQVSEITPDLVRDAIRDDERLIVFDGGDPIALITGSAAELGRRKDFFKHYPHEADECFGTCWRHDGHAEQDEPGPDEAEPEPVAVPEPVPVG